MAADAFVDLMRQMLWISLLLCTPVLGAAMLVGLVIGLLQAVTSIQEQTLAFVPKLVAVMAVLALTGSWMLTKLVDYSIDLFAGLPRWGAL